MSSTSLPFGDIALADAVAAPSLWTSAAAAAAALPDANAADPALAANVFGTAGNDTLNGGANADQIFGLGGNDTLNGRAGNDFLFGGEGNDTLTGGTGDDQLFGEAGDDRLVWSTGDGSDLIEGGLGTDRVEMNGDGNAETTQILNNGARVFVSTTTNGVTSTLDIAGVETLVVNGGGGNDTIAAGNGLATLTSLSIDGGDGNDTILGGDGNDTLLGGSGSDFVDGNRGNDTANLGSGDDVFGWDPGDGNDMVEGGSGTDSLQFNGSNADEEMVLSATGSHAVLTRNVATITMDLHGMENVNIRALGSIDNITIGDLRGTDVDHVRVDLSDALGGDDGAVDTVTVALTADNDALAFTVGTSTLNGLGAQVSVDNLGIGDRFMVDGGAGVDTVTANGTGGDDVIGIARDGTDSIAIFPASGLGAISITGVEQLLVQGGAGNDTINGQNGIATLTQLTIDGGTGNDTLFGGDGNDTLLGGSENDFVDGNRGNDTANLGSGDDVFGWDPGDGSDVVEGGSGDDTLQFNGSNAGEEMVLSANGSHAMLTRNVGGITMDLHGMENVNIRALSAADSITVGDLRGTDVDHVHIDLSPVTGGGDEANDVVTIEGTGKNDVIHLSMQNGALVVDGLAAQVVVQNFEAGDQIHILGLGGDDIIDASALPVGASIVLDGGEGNDVVLGGDGNDMLLGGAGDDVLIGGAGLDALDGGLGDNVLIQDGGNALLAAEFHSTDATEHAPLMP
jgi:Ca2+-binding RTX toxin-like protein